MRLYVVRHGQAEPRHPGGDARRPLTATGRRDAAALGRLLRQRATSLSRIVHSPFVRTTQTAEVMAAQLTIPLAADARLASGASVDDALAVIAEQPSSADVLLVGHQPTVGHLVHLLTGARAALAPATMAVIDLPRSASTVGVLVGLYEPGWLPADAP